MFKARPLVTKFCQLSLPPKGSIVSEDIINQGESIHT